MYRDYETLFRETLARNPGSSFLHNNLGVVLMSTGREREAASEFETAVRLTPDTADYHVNLGLALAQMPGRTADAVAEYQTALKIEPNLAAAHLNLGLAFASMPGRLEGRDRGVSESRFGLSNGDTERTRICGKPTLIWDLPTPKWPAGRPMRLRNTRPLCA